MNKIPTQAEFVEQIDAFLDRHEMKESRLAREATGEPGLIAAIRSGARSPTLATVEKLASTMARIDAEAATQAKLHPAEVPPPASEEETPLPFGTAPVNPTGASSPTSSSTSEPSPPSRDSASCPCSGSEAA